jgi:hypothetical protein
MLVAKGGARYVKFSLDGKGYGVLVVDIDSELNQEISNIKQNCVLGRELKLLSH